MMTVCIFGMTAVFGGDFHLFNEEVEEFGKVLDKERCHTADRDTDAGFNYERIFSLLRRGAHVDTRSPSGRTLLGFIANHGSAEKLQYVLTNYPNVNLSVVSEHHGTSLLQKAIYSGTDPLEKVELLCKAGIDVTYQDKAKETALHAVCSWLRCSPEYRAKQDAEVLPLLAALIRHGVPINAVNEDGDTVLHEMAGLGGKQSVVLLVQSGADVDIVNKEGKKPIDVTSDVDCILALKK